MRSFVTNLFLFFYNEIDIVIFRSTPYMFQTLEHFTAVIEEIKMHNFIVQIIAFVLTNTVVFITGVTIHSNIRCTEQQPVS